MDFSFFNKCIDEANVWRAMKEPKGQKQSEELKIIVEKRDR